MDTNIHNECWSCRHRRAVPGNAHIRCAKPDPGMTGDRRGVRSGWFFYPSCFDPVWKAKLCTNFEDMTKVLLKEGENL